jgi:hypothetical protein
VIYLLTLVSSTFFIVSNITAGSWPPEYSALTSTSTLVSPSRTANSDKTFYSDVVVQVSDSDFPHVASNRIVELPIPKSKSYGGATSIDFSLGNTAPSWATFDSDKNTVVVNTSAIPVMTEYSFELKSKVGPWSCEYSQTITIRVEH